jgi:hypothetical protein
MTEKARRIITELRRRDRKVRKRWILFRNPQARDRVLGEFNRSTLDDVGPLGGDQGMTVGGAH